MVKLRNLSPRDLFTHNQANPGVIFEFVGMENGKALCIKRFSIETEESFPIFHEKQISSWTPETMVQKVVLIVHKV